MEKICTTDFDWDFCLILRAATAYIWMTASVRYEKILNLFITVSKKSF